MDARLKDLILKCLNVNPQNRPTAQQLIKNPFIIEHLGLTAESSSQSSQNSSSSSPIDIATTTIAQPKVTNLPVQVYSTECIDIIIEKLVDKIFDRHFFDQDLRVEQIWEEPNRRHLAIALGMDYSDLVTISLYIYVFDLFSSD